jgi:2'-5' RNA ligase
MQPPRYAVVTYLHGPLANFVEDLRRQLAPEQAHMRAHLTLLSPRVLESPPEKLLSALNRICYKIESVQVALGQVETFLPVTSTVYLGLHEGARQVCDLHQRLNQYGLRAEDPWAYVPHVTLAKFDEEAVAQKALEGTRRQWSSYAGARDFPVKELTLVRETEHERWNDLAKVALPSGAL